MIPWSLWCVIGYFCGSVPFALLLGRLKGIDIRTFGSGNVGATNLGRALGRPWGIACFVLDVLKGFGPVFAAGWAMGLVRAWQQAPIDANEAWQWLAVAAAAVIGHVFPIWLRFKGGKGVATAFGTLLGVWPVLAVAGLGALLVWVVTVKLSRYVGLASVAAAVSLPVLVLVVALLRGQVIADSVPFLVVTTAMAALVIYRHRANVARILKGTEPKVGKRNA